MRIPLLADLHFREPWYRRLPGQKAYLSTIARDLLDGFMLGGLLPQMAGLSGWCARFPGNLAVSSGNPDGNELRGSSDPEGLAELTKEKRHAVGPMLRSKHWMDCLERPGLVTDRRTSLVQTPEGAVVVTMIPYNHWLHGTRSRTSFGRRDRDCVHALRHRGSSSTTSRRRKQPSEGTWGDPELFYKIREYRPDLVSGHFHAQPYAGSFAGKIDDTWCFNPGYPVADRAMKSMIPSHIVFDLAPRTATWHATPDAGRSQIIKQIPLT